jgi:hypothetical protein
MLSAFGIEHGDSAGASISKARLIRPRKPMRGTPGGRRGTRDQRRVNAKADPNVLSGPQRLAVKARRATEADISLKGIGEGAGRGFKGVGGFLEKRPGLTGTALVGGGGAAGYHYLSRKEPRR